MISIEDALICYVLVMIVIFLLLQWFNVTVWSSIVLAVLVALAALLLVYSPTKLLTNKKCDSVFLYIGIIVVSLIVIITYTTVKCVIDMNDSCGECVTEEFDLRKCIE